MAAKMTMKMSVAALLVVVVVLAAVAVAEEEAGWHESVNAAAGEMKEKAEEAVEGAKSWTDWAVGKLSEKFNEEKKEEIITTTEREGEAKDKVIHMATETQEKANGAYDKANEAYESAKGAVSDHAKAGYEAVKEKAAGAQNSGLPAGHNEL